MNKKIENILLWVGAAGAVISSITYIIVIVVLVLGVSSAMDMEQLLLVSIIGAVAGLLITFMLRTQGTILASNQEENKKIMSEYRSALNKTKKIKKLHTINYYMTKKAILDIFTKALTVGMTTYFMVSIFAEGNGDFSLIGLAIANTFMFISFGILALRSAYIYYNEDHIAAIKERIEILKKDQVGSVQPEGDKNETKQCEVLESTTTSGAEQEEHRVSGDDVQPDIHNSNSDTRSDIYTNSKLN